MTNLDAVPRRQVRLAVALYAALVVAALVGAGMLSELNASLQSEINAKSQLIDSLRRRALPTAARTGKPDTDAKRFAAIRAPTETVAASSLQKHVVEQLEQAGGEVKSVQAQPGRDSTADGLHRLTAQLVFDASTDTLQAFLFELETKTPYVFVDSLSAQPSVTPDTESETDAKSAKPRRATLTPDTATQTDAKLAQRLRATLVVSSYWSSTEKDTSGK